MASRLSGFRDPKPCSGKTSNRPDPEPGVKPDPDLVQPQVQDPSLVLRPLPNPHPGQNPVQSQIHSPGLNDDPVQSSGQSAGPDPVQESVELVSLLKDTSLLCAVKVETLEHISNSLTAPLTV